MNGEEANTENMLLILPWEYNPNIITFTIIQEMENLID